MKGVLRRLLHFQNPNAQAKLVSVLQGEVFDVAVDIRVGSPSFGEWVGVTLSAENKRQLYVPEGFAHDFLVTSEAALFSYMFSHKPADYYNSEAEHSVLRNDPGLGLDWPLESSVLSGKDRSGAHLAEIPPEKLLKHEVIALKKSGQKAEVK